jgi:predicted amidophosphoribosyltransferase
MANCGKCGAPLREGAKFCSKCGAKVEEALFCDRCGAKLKAGDAFCDQCGAPVGGAAPATAKPAPGTRKTVAAGCGHTVGLKADGTVVAVGWNEDGQRDVSDWRGIKLP